MPKVALVKYEEPKESLKEAIDLIGGLDDLAPASKVVIKPNIVIWHEGIDFPKYGVLTTSRMIEDMIDLLKERGVNDITIAEGGLTRERKPKTSMLLQAAEGLGLTILKDRYGIKIVDINRSSFSKVTKDNVTLSISNEILSADFLINIPVLKTHSQAVVSLGIKNLKGILNVNSRKLCHNIKLHHGLDYHLEKLVDMTSPDLTIIDGIYSNERGPLETGRAHRMDRIVASKDPLSADIVGSTLLGIDPASVPHIAATANSKKCLPNLEGIDIKGNLDIKTASRPHKWAWEQSESGNIPLFFEKAGVKGLTYRTVDTTLCTYCALLVGDINLGIVMSKNKDTLDDIEILYGKIQKPTGNHEHTLLVGQCQVNLNDGNPLINHCVKLPGCPAKRKDLLKAFEDLKIELPDNFLETLEKCPETIHMKKYINKPAFDPDFFRI